MTSSEFQFQLLHISRHDLWRMHKTLVELLQDGQYQVPELLAKSITSEDVFFKDYIGSLKTTKKNKTSTVAAAAAATEESEKKEKKKQPNKSERKRTKTKRNGDEDDDNYTTKRVAPSAPAKDTSEFLHKLTIIAHKTGLPEGEQVKPENRIVALFGKPALLRKNVLGKNAIDELSNLLPELGCHNVILSTARGFTAFVSAPLAELRQRYALRTFLFDELLINVTRHTLVRPHVRVGAEEQAKLLKHYRLRPQELNKFPKLLNTDPIARYYDWQPGTFIKVLAQGHPPMYKIVVEKPIVFTG